MGFRFIMFCAMALSAQVATAEWYSREEAIMGTTVSVQLWHENRKAAQDAMQVVMGEMHRIDEAMSPYKETSELSRINREAAIKTLTITQEMADILARSIEFSRLSDGAFDVTFSSVGYMYDYRQHVKPTDEQIAKALPGINYRHLILNREKRTLHFDRDGVRVDLGGIAKGWAVDRSIELLRKRGIRHARVTAGGDTRLLGDRRGRPWTVGIRDPRQQGKVIATLPLVDAAISTSGDYERFFEEDGVRYHHIINPKTGKSATGVRSVTVIAADATTTEGLTKSVFIKGPDAGLRLINSLINVDAIVIDVEGVMHLSAGLQDLTKNAANSKGSHR